MINFQINKSKNMNITIYFITCPILVFYNSNKVLSELNTNVQKKYS